MPSPGRDSCQPDMRPCISHLFINGSAALQASVNGTYSLANYTFGDRALYTRPDGTALFWSREHHTWYLGPSAGDEKSSRARLFSDTYYPTDFSHLWQFRSTEIEDFSSGEAFLTLSCPEAWCKLADPEAIPCAHLKRQCGPHVSALGECGECLEVS